MRLSLLSTFFATKIKSVKFFYTKVSNFFTLLPSRPIFFISQAKPTMGRMSEYSLAGTAGDESQKSEETPHWVM
jgi:hypothetical protein